MNYQKTAIIVKDTVMYRAVVAKLIEGGCDASKIGPSRGLFVITYGAKKGRVDYLKRNHPCVYTCVKKALDKDYKIVMGEDFLATPKLLIGWVTPKPARTVFVKGKEVSEETIVTALEALVRELKR